MKTISMMFVVAMMFSAPFTVNAAWDTKKDAEELWKEYAAAKKSNMKLDAAERQLAEQAPKLASQRRALAVRMIALDASEKKFAQANSAYGASCRVIFPKEVLCAKKRLALAQWEESLSTERDRMRKHAVALKADQDIFSFRQETIRSLREVNRRTVTCIETLNQLEAGKSLKKGGINECVRPIGQVALAE